MQRVREPVDSYSSVTTSASLGSLLKMQHPGLRSGLTGPESTLEDDPPGGLSAGTFERHCHHAKEFPSVLRGTLH